MDHNAHGQPHILQRSEELDVEGNIEQVLDQFPEQVLVSHAIVPGNHRLVPVPDLENHNHHLWLNIKQSVQLKALHHPEERTVGYVAIFWNTAAQEERNVTFIIPNFVMSLKQRANVLEDRIVDFFTIFIARHQVDLVAPLDQMLHQPELLAELHQEEILQDKRHLVPLLEAAIEVTHLELAKEDVCPHKLENLQLLHLDAATLLALDHHLHRPRLVRTHVNAVSSVETTEVRRHAKSLEMILEKASEVFVNC